MTSKPLIAAASKMNAEDTAKLMFERKIKKLPIVENGWLVGLVTLTDLVRSQDVFSFLNGLSTKDAPKRMKKVVNGILIVQSVFDEDAH